MSTPIVVNEWLIADLKGDNSSQKQEETFLFLKFLEKKCDKIVIMRETPLFHKLHKLMKESDPVIRELSKFLRLKIILNPSKCLQLDPIYTELPNSLSSSVSQKDKYLFQIHLKVKGSLLLTTDQKLWGKTSNHPEVNIQLRDEFLKRYLQQS